MFENYTYEDDYSWYEDTISSDDETGTSARRLDSSALEENIEYIATRNSDKQLLGLIYIR